MLNLWAVVQYVTKYATKAPKGSRRLNEVLKDAVDEVCQYVPEIEGSDLMRRSIEKFFARSLGERDYHAYEAVQLGLQLPLVIPMTPIVSLNTSGVSPVQGRGMNCKGPRTKTSQCTMIGAMQRNSINATELVKAQWDGGDKSAQPKSVRDLSLYEFWWKYNVYKGHVRPSARPRVFHRDRNSLQCASC